jgi:hypothetical protein
MPRIIVTTEPSLPPGDAPVLLNEQVHSVHLSSGHAAAQLVERIAWAISDAEAAEGTHPDRRAMDLRPSSRPPVDTRSGARLPIGA